MSVLMCSSRISSSPAGRVSFKLARSRAVTEPTLDVC